ncbi:serine O-acetyltransferase [Gelidibacter algens]|uniref:Serine O-acetyltransferase n=1 Tax=Gelidibacter algens TaxID=49280 RepID=A0A1A7QQV7_9FLAO|nr:serine acetyltransferase [Gelidibacter algens]OBX21891.1 serine acetyltransferase [Gelidibacter algens]RAJ27433.1 serine O-acetyltransferase [Gelidibacter algens]
MINNKKDYLEYLTRDRIALEIYNQGAVNKIKNLIFPDPVWTFQKRMRQLEYYTNCKNYGLYHFYIYYLKYRYKLISIKLNFTIPINVFGPGLSIVHYGTIIINFTSKIGSNCRIHACVNIGASGGEIQGPQLGDNIYIAPGAKIYGNIWIPNNTAIGANAVVNKSFTKENTIIAGIPAKVIGEVDIKKIIKYI